MYTKTPFLVQSLTCCCYTKCKKTDRPTDGWIDYLKFEVCKYLCMHVHKLIELDTNMLLLSQHNSLRVAAAQGSVGSDWEARKKRSLPASVNLPVEFRLIC